MVRITNRRTNVRAFRLFAAASVAVLGMSPRSWAAQVTARWDGTTNNWSSGAHWSTAPNYPNNGTPSGSLYDVVIDSAGSGPYTVTLDVDAAINSLSLNNANATLDLATNDLDLAPAGGSYGSVNVQAGRIGTNFVGSLANATLAVGPSASVFGDLSLNNVRLASDLTLPAGTGINVLNSVAHPMGLDFNGFAITLNPGASLFYKTIVNGPLASRVNGTVNLTGGGASLAGSGVKIDAGAKVNVSGAGINNVGRDQSSVTNDGVITASGGTTLNIQPSTFTNNGTIQLTGSGTTLSLGGDNHSFSNTGKILADPVAAIAATQTINVTGRLHSSDLGLGSGGNNATFTSNGAKVVVSDQAVIFVTDDTMTFGSAQQNWTLQTAFISDGTLVAENRPDGTSYLNIGNFITLGNVKLGADLTLSNPGKRVLIRNQPSNPLGLDFNGHAINVTGDNFKLEINGAVNGSGVYLADTINGNVNLIGKGAQLLLGQGEITVSSNATIAASSGGSNFIFHSAGVTNYGTLAVTNGTIFTLGSFINNHGTYALRNGTFDRAGNPLDVGDGTLTGWGTINGSVALSSASSKLALNIAGRTQGAGYDSLTITGPATLGGNLQFTLANGFVPLPGDTFTVLTASSVSGTFLNVADGGRLFDTTGKGSFLVHYGSGAYADEIVLTNFQAVPEPASVGLLAAGLTGLTMRRRRRSAGRPGFWRGMKRIYGQS